MAEEIKRKLSQEEKRFANLAKRFIRQASVAVKNFRMFGEKHPVLTNSMRNIQELLKTLLEGRESISFTFLEGSLLVEDLQLKDMDPKAYSLIIELKECGITSISFEGGVAENELAFLLKSISSGPAFLKEEGGLGNALKKRNVSHIKIDETYFKRVSKKTEEVEKAKTQLADMLLVDFLTGKKSLGKADMANALKEASLNPGRMANTLSKAASSSGAHPAAFAQDAIGKLAGYMKTEGGLSSDKTKAHIGNILLSFKPSFLKDVVASASTRDGESALIIQEAISAFSDEVILNVITHEITKEKASLTEARQLIRRLLPDEARRSALLPLLEKRLVKKGIPQSAISAIVEGKFWPDMTHKERAEAIQKNEASYLVEIGLIDQGERFINELLSKKEYALLDSVVAKLVENFSAPDEAFKTRFVRDFGKIALTLFRSKEYKKKDALLSRLVDESLKANDVKIKSRFTGIFKSLVPVFIEYKNYNYLAPSIRATGYGSVKQEILSGKTLGEFFNMLFKESCDSESIKKIVALLGREAEEALCEALISIRGADFESFKKRHKIDVILKGRSVEPFFIKKLSSNKPGELQIALETLGEIGTSSAIPGVEKCLDHTQEKIRRHAAITLKKLKKK